MGHLTAKEASEKAKEFDSRTFMTLDVVMMSIKDEVEKGNFDYSIPGSYKLSPDVKNALQVLGYEVGFCRVPFTTTKLIHISW